MAPESRPKDESGLPPRPLLYGILTAGIVAVSSAALLIRLASDASPLAVAAWRLLLAALLLAPLALLRRPSLPMAQRDRLLAAVTGVFLALHFVLWITSLRYTSVASSVVLVSTTPVFVALGSLLVLRERLRPGTILAIPASVAGGILIGFGGRGFGESALSGDLLAVGGAIMMSCGLLIGRRVRQRVRLVDYVFTSYGTAGGLVLIACLALGVPLFGFRGTTYLYLALLALGPQLVGHSTFNWALRYLPASTVAVLALGEPIGSSLFAWGLLGERLNLLEGIGGGLILLGIYLTMREGGTPVPRVEEEGRPADAKDGT